MKPELPPLDNIGRILIALAILFVAFIVYQTGTLYMNGLITYPHTTRFIP